MSTVNSTTNVVSQQQTSVKQNDQVTSKNQGRNWFKLDAKTTAAVLVGLATVTAAVYAATTFLSATEKPYSWAEHTCSNTSKAFEEFGVCPFNV